MGLACFSLSVIAVPLLSGQMPEWSAEQMRQHFPALVGWVVYGAFLGIIHQALRDSAEHFFGPEAAPKVSAVSVTKRIVIHGGGFAGMRSAECLEEKLRTDFSVSLTLINETNALLFTPMLAEVAGSSLEPSHISTPLRSTLRRTEFIRGVVADVHLEKRLVILHGDAGADGAPGRREVPYDHLVYEEAMESLPDARRHADDVLVYDNTQDGKGHRLVARFIAGELVKATHSPPEWLKNIFGRELHREVKTQEPPGVRVGGIGCAGIKGRRRGLGKSPPLR